eukprot:PhF_6_TR15681/c0_g1_i1/m.24382/K18204/D2HGDH; D-2-hydroxyglutarate dehydrogenase
MLRCARGGYGALTVSHIANLRALLSNPNDLITGPDALAPYNSDWLKLTKGNSEIGIFPRTTLEVSNICKYCNDNNLAIVPQGGNTSLVQGANPVYDEIVLSTKNMNRIVSVDAANRTCIAESGVILQTLGEACEERGVHLPYDLGARGSCTVGGNVATNAGGVRTVKYGTVQNLVLGLEVVLADGSVLDMLTTHRKDNTGYDMKRLFVGSEGTLGVVTQVAFGLVPTPLSVQVLMHRCDTFDDVRFVLERALEHFGTALSAFEVMDRQSLQVQTIHKSELPPGLLGEHTSKYANEFYVLIETHGSDQTYDMERLLQYQEKFEEGQRNGERAPLVSLLAESTTQQKMMWALRENISSALNKRGKCWKYDVTLKLDDYYDIVEVVKQQVETAGISDDVIVCGYGHVADGNLHLNVVDSTRGGHDAKVKEILHPYLYDEVAKRGGSISAEHGIGLGKRDALARTKNAVVLQKMKLLKNTFDPKGILNP